MRGDDGAVLVVALAFLLLFALFIPALLGQTTTGLSVSGSVELQRLEVYGAEAGLRARVETLRSDRTSAVFGTSCGPTDMGTFNGKQVRVQCTPQPSSGMNLLTRPEYALLALPTVDSTIEGIVDSPTVGGGGGTSDVYVGGNIASNGKIEHVAQGAESYFFIDGTANGHSCMGGNIVRVNDPDEDVCSAVSTTFEDPGVTNSVYAMSDAGNFPAATNPAPDCLENAVKFLPGYYTAMPTAAGCSAAKPWWFSPGLYYFDFTGMNRVLDLDGKTVVAGTPNPANFNPDSGSTPPVMPGSCKVDGDLPPYEGTEWVFGADTVLDIGTGAVELCPSVTMTTQQISVRGYGAGGVTSDGETEEELSPTSHSQSPATAYTVAGVDTGSRAYAIDDSPATAVVTTGNRPRSFTLTLSDFPDLPGQASVEKVELRIKHQEVGAPTAPVISAVVDFGANATDLPVGCDTGQLCMSATAHEDVFDLTDDFTSAGGDVSQISVEFTVTPARNTVTTETLDGVELDVTYAAPGGFRKQAGCAVLPVTASYCDTVSNDDGGQLYVQGTVYAPLGRVAVVTADGDPVRLNRGVIARDIVGAIHPGNGSANPFGLGRPQRLAFLTAEVLEEGSWKPVIESLVRFDDNVATNRGRATALSWRVLR